MLGVTSLCVLTYADTWKSAAIIAEEADLQVSGLATLATRLTERGLLKSRRQKTRQEGQLGQLPLEFRITGAGKKLRRQIGQQLRPLWDDID